MLQLQRVELAELDCELFTLYICQLAAVQQSLVWGLRGVIVFGGSCPVTFYADQFGSRPEEVGVETGQSVHFPQLLQGGL